MRWRDVPLPLWYSQRCNLFENLQGTHDVFYRNQVPIAFFRQVSLEPELSVLEFNSLPTELSLPGFSWKFFKTVFCVCITRPFWRIKVHFQCYLRFSCTLNILRQENVGDAIWKFRVSATITICHVRHCVAIRGISSANLRIWNFISNG